MEYSTLGDLKLSRMGLGTVQFGRVYGIANKSGQVDFETVVRILLKAVENGVNVLDTSRAYGSSEEVIGRAFSVSESLRSFAVCTKLDLPANFRDMSNRDVLKAAQSSLHASLKALRLDSLQVYLLHSYEYKTHRSGLLWEWVLDEKKKGTIRYAGVSIGGGPPEAMSCLEDPGMDALQIPYNALDHRWNRQKVLGKAVERGVFLFGRSAYLQGLLLMTPEEANEKLPGSGKYIRELRVLSDEHRLTPKELAMAYVSSEKAIGTTVVGQDSEAQLRENMELYRQERLPAESIIRIRETFKDVPETLVNPVLWRIGHIPRAVRRE